MLMAREANEQPRPSRWPISEELNCAKGYWLSQQEENLLFLFIFSSISSRFLFLSALLAAIITLYHFKETASKRARRRRDKETTRVTCLDDIGINILIYLTSKFKLYTLLLLFYVTWIKSAPSSRIGPLSLCLVCSHSSPSLSSCSCFPESNCLFSLFVCLSVWLADYYQSL